MDATKVGNHFVDEGAFTYHICARCIAFYGDGEYRFLGKVGCCMPKVTKDNKGLFKEWKATGQDGEEKEYKRCFRCFIGNQECCAVPEELYEDFGAVHQCLVTLRHGYQAVADDSPSTVAPSSGQATPARNRPSNRVPLTGDQVDALCFKLSKLCKEMSRKLNKEYSPHSAHLHLHSGALTAEDVPGSDIRPGGRKRDNKTVAVKLEAKKRSLEASVAEALKKEVEQQDSPRKRNKTGKVIFNPHTDLERKKNELRNNISELRRQRDSTTKNKKAGYTKSINRLQKELDELDTL